MATITWTGSVGGSWTTPTNWNLGRLPGASDTATIDKGSAELFSATETVNALDIGSLGGVLIDYESGQSGGNLTVTGTLTNNGTFEIGNDAITELATVTANTLDNDATGLIGITGNTTAGSIGFGKLDVVTGTNAGTIDVADNGALEIGGAFTNSGTIALDGVTNPAQLQVADTGLSLSGGGTVTLSNHSAIITAPDAALNLTIDGSATPTPGDTISLTFTNTNLSLDETVNYTVQSTDTTSAILAISLAEAIDSNSVLAGDGIIATTSGNVLIVGQPGALGNRTAVVASVSGTETVTPGSALLSGGANPRFTNVNNAISGEGTIGDSSMTLVNKGIINANVAAGLMHTTALILDTGRNTISNSGTLEATASGGLDVESNVTNAKTIQAVGTDAKVVIDAVRITNNGGLISASGTGANVDLNGATIVGGTLDTAGTNAMIETLAGGSEIDNAVIAAGSVVEVNDNTALTLVGAIANAGTIALDGFINPTQLMIDGTVTLSGAGQVTLSNSIMNNEIVGNGTLINAGNTIAGQGMIGVTLKNNAVIDANAGNGLILDAVTITNTGTLEATAGAELAIFSNVANTGFIKASGTGANVDLNGTTIVGGTLETGAGGVIEASDGFTGNEISGVTIALGSVVKVSDNNALTLAGAIDNAGTIALEGSVNPTKLIIDGTVTLSGTGHVTLSNNGNNTIVSNGSAATLINARNTIAGSGTIGDSHLTLENKATIDADVGNVLILDAVTITNTGTLEATAGADLSIFSNVANSKDIEAVGTNSKVVLNGTITNTGGLILAFGAGASVDLGFATIVGGTLETRAGAMIETSLGTTGNEISGVTIAAGSVVAVSGNTFLVLAGTIANAGTIELSSIGLPTQLVISGAVSLTGAGQVTLSSASDNGIFSYSSATLNNDGNTIIGQGIIGNSDLTLNNKAVIDADAGSGLTLDTGSNTINNSGTLEATAGAGLYINSNVDNSKTIEALGANSYVILDGVTITNTITNTGRGQIQASGTGAVVVLAGGAKIVGGTLETGVGAMIQINGGTGNEISGVTLGGDANVEVNDNTALTLAHTISGGVFNLNSTGDSTQLIISGAVTLTGSVSLSDNGNNAIVSNGSPATLTFAGLYIDGSGTIGDANLTLNNKGTIESFGSIALILGTGSNTIGNTGTLVANAGAQLDITSNVANSNTIEALGSNALVELDGVTITNGAAGLVLASGTGANVNLNGATILGGTLEASGAGANVLLAGAIISGAKLKTGAGAAIETSGGGSDTEVSGVTIAAGSVVKVSDNSELRLAGTIDNAGTIELNSTGGLTRLLLYGSATLTGAGQVTLSNNPSLDNSIGGNSSGTLTNAGNTIAGAGTIFDTNLTLDNEAVIDANASNRLILFTGTNTITNTGTLEATASGGLDIESIVANSKAIEAVGTNVEVVIGGDITDTTTGFISASGTGANVQLEGVTISGGTLKTSGTNAVIEAYDAFGTGDEMSGVTIDGLVEVENAAELTLQGGATIGLGAVVETLSGGTLSVTGIVANYGTFFASGANSLVEISGIVDGGTAEVGNGIVEIAGASSENVSFLATGTGGLELDGLNRSYTGDISGFGGVDHGNASQDIDFAGVSFTGESFTYTPANSANTSGTLTVTDGTHSASVTLVGQYVKADFKAEDINGTLAITDPITYYASAYTNSAVLASSSGDLVFESTLNNTGTLEAENGNDIEVIGAFTNSNLTETTGTGASDINLDGSVSNTGDLAASTGDITVEGALTNSATGAFGPGIVATNGSAVMSIEFAITNAGVIESTGNSQMLLDVSGVATATLITNNGTIEAQNTSLISMAPGNGTGNVGLVNHGIMIATNDAELLVEAGTSSFLNNGTTEADASGLVIVNTFFANFGTIEANGSGAVLLNGSAFTILTLGGTDYSLNNSGVLLVTGQGSITVANAASGGAAEIDGTGTINNTTGAISGAIDYIALESRSNINVSFGAGASGLLELGGPAYGNYYSGTITGFTEGDAIDLTDIAYTISSVNDTVIFNPNTNGDGGVLEVKNGSSVLASLNLAGFDPTSDAKYTSSSFILNSDGHGGTIITDPTVTLQQPGNAPAAVGNGAILEIDTPDSGNVSFTGSSGKLVLDQPATFTGAVKGFGAQNGIDLSQIAFGGNNLTLGYAENTSGTGGTLSVGDGVHSANVALLGNYMASSFVTAADGHGGTLITEASQTSAQPQLAHPHAG
jgi:hypothetical protein